MLSAVIYAKDPRRLAVFYEPLIGGEILADPDGGFVTLAPPTGAFELHIVAAAQEIRDRIEISVPPAPRTETPMKLVLDVDITDEVRRIVNASGGSLAPEEEMWTWRDMVHCDGVDPEGNVFQLRSPASSLRSDVD